jgi:uncharacterized protein YbjT (DUF2867 family)
MTDLLVLGGSGRTGVHVLEQAAQRGHRVRGTPARPRLGEATSRGGCRTRRYDHSRSQEGGENSSK